VLASIKGGSYAISANRGDYWEIIEAKELGEIKSFHVDSSDTIYAGTENGIFISSDLGYTWNKANINPSINNLVINRFKTDDSGNLWGCSKSRLVKRERNFGNWSLINLDSIIKTNINDLSFFIDSVYIATDSGLYVSPSDGSVYKRVINKFSTKKVNSIENVFGKFFIGLQDTFCLFVSEDSLKTWYTETTTKYSPVYHIKRVETYFSSICMVHNRGIFMDRDKGIAFMGFSQGLQNPVINKSFFGKSHYSNKKVRQFFITSNNFCDLDVYQHDSISIIGGYSMTAYVPQMNHVLTAGIDSSNNIYYSDYPGPLYRSKDDGHNWTAPDSSVYNITDMITTREGSIFALSMNGNVFCSRDNGLQWKKQEGLDPAFYISYTDLGQILLVNKDRFTISHDNGSTWTTSESSFSQSFTDSIKSYSMIKNNIASAGKLGIYYTSDLGKTWSKSDGAPGYKFNTLLQQGDYLFASCDSGIYRSGDKGATWTDFSEGLPGRKEGCHLLCTNDDGYIFVSINYFGMYRSASPVLGIAPEAESKSGIVIYPNPAGEVIYISHPEGIQINEVEISDILGSCRHVQDYESGSINLNGLEPGTYFARIKTNRGLFVERFVVVRM
jgi:photosystem II stability/assembly factor-like uncharacterized protein